MKSFTTPKGTVLPLLDLMGKSYLQVPHRIMWAREEHPDWVFDVSFPVMNDKYVMARAQILDETGRLRAVAHKVEHFAHFQDAVEKSESSAIGRALAHLGYGTQFAIELDESSQKTGKVVDAPLEPPAHFNENEPPLPNYAPNAQPRAANESKKGKYTITERQVKRLWAIAHQRGFSAHDVMSLVSGAKFNDPESLDKESYDEICTFMEKNKPEEDNIPF